MKLDKISMLHSYLNTYPEQHPEEGCQGHSSSALSCSAWLLQGRSLRLFPTLEGSGKENIANGNQRGCLSQQHLLRPPGCGCAKGGGEQRWGREQSGPFLGSSGDF